MANLITAIIGFIFHIDSYIGFFIQQYDLLTYAILFAIIFLETGLVITPFLPGDSLLFVTGAFAARGDLNVMLAFFLLSIAAILGDSVNYWIGNYFGKKAFSNTRLLKREYLERTENFYEKHGGKTIILARFIPIIRTFAPFVAGIAKMNYRKFLSYNIIGGIAWVGLLVFAGFLFGEIPIIKENLSLVIIIIIIISILPLIREAIRR